MHHEPKPPGLAAMFLKSIAATNVNGLAARPAARPVSATPAPEPRAAQAEPEAVPEPATAPQSPSRHAVARSVLRTVAAIDANGLTVLRARLTNVSGPEPLDPASPHAALRAHLRRFTGGGSQ
jgi:flagellar hook-length control protein FliK